MGLLRKRAADQTTAPPTAAESPQQLITTSGQASLYAHTEFVKQVECARCGAPKRLPSKTAYLYCDHCGSLVDYDFRLANLGTNAGYTNTVYRQVVAPVQADIDRARAVGDRDRYRGLTKGVYAEWLRQCPQAASPRASSDEDFRDRMATYMTECALVKDFDPGLAMRDAHFKVALGTLQRRPMPSRPWLVNDAIWQVAAIFKEQMEAPTGCSTTPGCRRWTRMKPRSVCNCGWSTPRSARAGYRTWCRPTPAGYWRCSASPVSTPG